jgi:hypothetical protein
LYGFFYNWQTLFTGLLAVVAAFIAAQPMWRQLSKINIQASIMAREVLAKRLSAFESRRIQTKKLLDEITSDFSREMYFDSNAASNPHWAFSAEEKVGHAIKVLLEDQASKMDSVFIDSIRDEVLESVRKLEGCLNKIHAPHSHDLQDPEYALSEQDISKIEQDAEKAPSELPECITFLDKSARSLENAFLTESDKLKSKIRTIDDLIIEDQIE